jgi:hypothetical protein
MAKYTKLCIINLTDHRWHHCYLQIQDYDCMSNAEDPDLSGKQMDRYNIVGFPAEKLPPKIANHSISAPSQEVLFSP